MTTKQKTLRLAIEVKSLGNDYVGEDLR